MMFWPPKSTSYGIGWSQNRHPNTLQKMQIYVWLFLAMDFTPHFVFNFQVLKLATRMYLDIFSFYMTHGDMVQILVKFFSSPETQKPKCSNTISKLQYICQVLLKATAATTIETSTTREAFGTWRWWLVVSVPAFCQEFHRKLLWSKISKWCSCLGPTKVVTKENQILGHGHWCKFWCWTPSKWKMESWYQATSRARFFAPFLGKRIDKFHVGDHLQLSLSATIIQLVHHIIRFENIQILRHRNTLLSWLFT